MVVYGDHNVPQCKNMNCVAMTCRSCIYTNSIVIRVEIVGYMDIHTSISQLSAC